MDPSADCWCIVWTRRTVQRVRLSRLPLHNKHSMCLTRRRHLGSCIHFVNLLHKISHLSAKNSFLSSLPSEWKTRSTISELHQLIRRCKAALDNLEIMFMRIWRGACLKSIFKCWKCIVMKDDVRDSRAKKAKKAVNAELNEFYFICNEQKYSSLSHNPDKTRIYQWI